MTAAELFYPYLNGKIVNIIFYEKNISSFQYYCLVYAILFFFNEIIVNTTNNFMAINLITGFIFDIKKAIYKKILNGNGKYLAGLYSGDIISRMNQDASALWDFIFWSCMWGFACVINITISIWFIFYYNVYLGLFSIMLAPAVYFSSKHFKKKIQLLNHEITTEKGKLTAYLFEVANNLSEIKILGACKRVVLSYTKRTTLINKMSVKSGEVEVTSERITALIALVAQLMIFTVCSFFIVKGSLQLGVFIAAMSYFNMAVNYFTFMNNRIIDVGKQTVSIARVMDILNCQEEDYKEDSKITKIKNSEIEFKNITFGYKKNNHVLERINLFIEAGSIIGLVGKSGIGKTTMANIIYGLYRIDDGELLIGGININNYNLHSLRNQIGIVHQEMILYDDTVRYNLSFSNTNNNDDILLEALYNVGLHDVFMSLPQGLDTQLGIDGISLSGGQKQRLAIARILVKNPKILIFDEATSFLDSQNELLVRKIIKAKTKEQTVIIIAHRLSTIINCDKIAVLSDGGIVGYDKHDVLIKNNDVYSALFHRQFLVGEVI